MQLPAPWRPLGLVRGARIAHELAGFLEGDPSNDARLDPAGPRPPGVRLIVRTNDPAAPFEHRDLTSNQVAAMLEGFLNSGAHADKIFTFRAAGKGSTRKMSVHIKPKQETL
jgi:hypothetical protein